MAFKGRILEVLSEQEESVLVASQSPKSLKVSEPRGSEKPLPIYISVSLVLLHPLAPQQASQVKLGF